MVRQLITPDIAASYLKKNVNRKLRQRHVDRLARDMESGEWRETHQAIAFNCDGSLKDGQHRLHAVVKSGVAVWFFVAHGLSDDAVMHIDTHATRSDVDAYQLMGDSVKNLTVAVAKQMYAGPTRTYSPGMLSRDGLREFIRCHAEALHLGCSGGSKARVGQAAVRSVISRAYYHADPVQLRRFLALVLHGADEAYTTSEAAALKLRDHLLTTSNGGSGYRQHAYQRTQSALSAYLEGRKITKLYARAENLFPLPRTGGQA